MSDPDVPGTRYHTVIFVETASDGSGYIHHVTGDLVAGMRYERKLSRRPEESQTFFNKEALGMVSSTTYPQCVDDICRVLRAPPPQKAFNRATMRTEPCKPDGSFYRADESPPRLVKCTEWTENQAIPALRQALVIENGESEWIWFPQQQRYARKLANGNWEWAPSS